MKVFLALSLLACSTFCGAATLTINNLSTQAWIFIPDDRIDPVCRHHPAFPRTCALGPSAITTFVLQEAPYNSAIFTVVATHVTPNSLIDKKRVYLTRDNADDTEHYEVQGSSSYSYKNAVDTEQFISCDTVNRSAVSIEVTIKNHTQKHCQTPDDEFIEWVENTFTSDMMITVRDIN